jgi:hypothetical protein
MGDRRKLRRRRFEATSLTMVRDGDRGDGIHEVSIRKVGDARRDGALRSKRSMMIMRPPQHGQGAAYASVTDAGCSGSAACSAAGSPCLRSCAGAKA